MARDPGASRQIPAACADGVTGRDAAQADGTLAGTVDSSGGADGTFTATNSQ